MELIRIKLAKDSETTTSKDPGFFSWADPLSQPRDDLFQCSATLGEPLAADHRLPGTLPVARKAKRSR